MKKLEPIDPPATEEEFSEYVGWLEKTYGDEFALAMHMSGNRCAFLHRMLFNWDLSVCQIGDQVGIDDSWSYENLEAAISGLLTWGDDKPEPEGWTRNLKTGRRRPDGDPTKEYISD